MSLLTNAMNHSLDDGYAQAAARRGVEGRSGLPRTAKAKLWLAVGLLLTGLVVTVGAAQAQVSAPQLAEEREKLVERINDGTERADSLEDQVEDLRADVEGMQRKALEKHGGDRSEVTALLAGATGVRGPGIKLVVDDAKSGGEGDSGGPRESNGFSDTGRVRDRDLQRVVNGLWKSGAEAVSINGQRLTALSAIRAAGDAILVDNRPLAPPYTLLAVGPGEKLSTTFQNSSDGQYLHVLQEEFGVRTAISTQDDLRLPAASRLTIRNAEPVKTGEGST